MKVLHLLDEPWDSGITAYALQIALILQNHGIDITIGVRSGKKPETLAQSKGLKTISFSSPFQLISLLKKSNWELINVHTGRTHTWSILARILSAQAHRIPLIRTRGDARSLTINPLSRFVYRQTQGVIAASDHVRRLYETGFGFNEEQVRTIYPSVVADAKIQPLPQGKIGILGRLDPVKGHSVFIEAAASVLKKFPETEFRVAGKEANITTQILYNQTKQLGIESQVKFLGFQASAENFMRTCTIGVIASLGSEEVSRSCLEWMGTARPVIGTLVGCLPELIEPNETGFLVPPGDSKAMAEAIIGLLENPGKAVAWGKAGHNLVQRRFSPAIQLDKTLRIYNWVKEKFQPAKS